MQDPCSNYHGGNPASVAAFKSVKEDAATIRAQVLKVIGYYGDIGTTCDWIESRMDLPHQTVSARCTELLAQGKIIRRGDKRETRSGRKAYVLRAV